MKFKGSGLGKTIGKVAAICGAAGALEIFTNCFLFGGKLGNDSEDSCDDEATEKDTTETTEETEKVSDEDITIEEKTE